VVRRSVPASQLGLFSPASKNLPGKFELHGRQRDAVEHVRGPMLVVAGAGTGKTTVLTQRIAYLVRNGHARPDEILAITYTDNAAAELVKRVGEELGPAQSHALAALTFHAYCYGLLGRCRRQFRVVEPLDLWVYLRRRLSELQLRYYTRAASPAQFLEALLDFFDNCHDELRTEDDYDRYVEELAAGKHPLPRVTRSKDADGLTAAEVLARCREIAHAFRCVEQMLAQAGLGTYGHMILRAMQILRSEPAVLAEARSRTRYVLVDEFQDSNIAQIGLAQLLAGDERNLFVVGDPDQAIYRFRGASSAAFEEFIARFPETRAVVLDRNQRSTSSILNCAHAVIAYNPAVKCPLGNDVRFDRQSLISDREARATRAGTPLQPERVDLGMVSSAEDEARDVAEDIQRRIHALGAGGLTGGKTRCAVLYRQHSHRELVVKELASRGIPFKVEGLDAMETVEVRDLLACLRAVQPPADTGALLRVAALPTFGLDALAVRDALRAGGRDQDLASILRGVRGGEGVLSAVENARAELAAGDWHAQRAVEIVIKRFGLDASAPPLQAVRQFVKAWSEKPITFSGKLDEFLDYMHWFPQAGGCIDYRQPEMPQANAVRLMTVHAAKGLEFDHVYLLRATSGSFPTGYREKLFSMPPQLRDPRSLAPDDDSELHKQEERRLFYVGMTRARDSLGIYGRVRGKARTPAGFVRELMQAEVASPGWIQRRIEPKVQLEASAGASQSSGLGAWFLLPPSARLKQSTLSASAIEDYEICPLRFKIRRDWVLPGEISGALKYGVAVHLALRDFYDAILAGRPRTVEALSQIFHEALLDQAFDDKHQLDLYRRQGQEQLRHFFEAWVDGEKPEVLHTEKNFDLKINGLLVRGRVDRVDRLSGDGVAIVDYKTGSPKDEIQARKSLQLSIYALAAAELWKVRPERLVFYNLETNEEIATTRSEEQLEETRGRIQEVAENIAAGNFEPEPGFHCRSCLFRAVCPATEERLYTCVSAASAATS
jgi:DNA helicase II / ATP-dependent DNA helicase PcrA